MAIQVKGKQTNILNPFPTELFYTNEAAGGGGLFVTPYVFVLKTSLKIDFFKIIFKGGH